MVLALQNGDKTAFNFLFDNYYASLVGYLSMYTRNKERSEDIAQHVFMKLWENRSELESGVSPKNYLYTIAYNRFIDIYRKEARQKDVLKELSLANLTNRIEEDSEVLENRILRLKKIIDTLPPRCKEILILSRQRGLEYGEIADLLNISTRTVEKQILIAFKKIRKAFKSNSILFFLLSRKLRTF